MNNPRTFHRAGERGITILLVAVAMIAVLAMAALAIDVVTLYVARAEAQRAADAAALAGAKMFVTSGFTSGLLGTPISSTVQNEVCTNSGPGSSVAANKQAEQAAAQNQVAGQPAVIESIACDFSQPTNPRITVTVQRTNLPTFFSRIWGNTAKTVRAQTAAEAYNPSGSAASVQVQGVKPWLLRNCDPNNTLPPGNPNCSTQSYFVNPADGSIANDGSFIGQAISLDQEGTTAPPSPWTFYYALSVPIDPPAAECPGSGVVGCNQVGSGPYYDNIACSARFQFSCGQIIGAGQPALIDTRTGSGFLQARHMAATQCLIHAGNPGLGSGQDLFTPNGIGSPVNIDGGLNNPNPALRGANNISRSDSVITVPLYDGHNMCPGGACTETATVVGFLQLGITEGDPGGKLDAVILNAAGCNPGATGNPVAGGGVSPIPVRLIHQ